MSEDSRDWANLLPELIHLISQKLPDVTDIVRFRSVCKSWWSSAPLSDPPSQLPWLLEISKTCFSPSHFKDNVRFYSLSTQKTGIIPLKQSHISFFHHGSFNGYLYTLSSDRLTSLWNPLTNAIIGSVPSHGGLRKIWPLWTGYDPIMSQKIVFQALLKRRQCLAVYHPIKMKWNFKKGIFYGVCYSDDMLFLVNKEKGNHTEVYDGNLENLLYKIPQPEYVHLDIGKPKIYHVKVSGEVMRVHRYYLRYGKSKEECCFHIYKLNHENRNGKPCWVKVSHIGDHMLFLDLNSGISLKAPVAGFKGNCIYCLDLHYRTPYKYDIATGTIEWLSSPFGHCTWFMPTLS